MRLFYDRVLADPELAGYFAEVDMAEEPEIGMRREGGGQWRRVVIEKPFGTDLQSARDLNRRRRLGP